MKRNSAEGGHHQKRKQWRASVGARGVRFRGESLASVAGAGEEDMGDRLRDEVQVAVGDILRLGGGSETGMR